MTPLKWIESSLDYGCDLVNSGWEGVRFARLKSQDGAPVTSLLTDAVRTSWPSAAVGAYLGALGAALGSRRKPNYGAIAVAGLLGATIGLASGMAWGTRHLTADMAREAKRNLDHVRDAHWLKKNPIPYG